MMAFRYHIRYSNMDSFFFNQSFQFNQFGNGIKLCKAFWDSLDHSHEGQSILKVRYMMHAEDKAG